MGLPRRKKKLKLGPVTGTNILGIASGALGMYGALRNFVLSKQEKLRSEENRRNQQETRREDLRIQQETRRIQQEDRREDRRIQQEDRREDRRIQQEIREESNRRHGETQLLIMCFILITLSRQGPEEPYIFDDVLTIEDIDID